MSSPGPSRIGVSLPMLNQPYDRDAEQLGPGIATAASRTPYEMANAAADVDELSDGRTLLGLSLGGAGVVETLNGTEIDRPLTRLREYIEVMRAVWQHFDTDEPFDHQGRIYRAAGPPFIPFGNRALVRPRIPIYLAALQERMLQLAGETADGVICYLTHHASSTSTSCRTSRPAR